MKPYRAVKARIPAAHATHKDIWDKVGTLTPSFVTLVLGLLGAYATYSYNERSLAEKKEETAQALSEQRAQARSELEQRRQQTQDARMLAETQQLERLFTYVSSRDPQSREFGYSMFAALGREELALRLINFKRDTAGTALAQRLRSSDDPMVRAAAEDSLATLRSMSDRFTITNSPKIAAPVRSDLSNRLGLFVAYLARIGFSPPRKPIQIDTTPDDEINAYYDPDEHKIFISSRVASDSHAALAVYTNYLLNITSRVDLRHHDSNSVDNDYNSIEAALDDYFSSSYLNEPRIAAVMAALMGTGRGYLRNLDNSLSYAQVGKERVEPHAVGEVWGGAFWAMREKIGRAKLDRVLVQAWKSLKKSPTRTVAQSFVDSLAAAADRMLSPSDATAVRTVLALRGFPSPEV